MDANDARIGQEGLSPGSVGANGSQLDLSTAVAPTVDDQRPVRRYRRLFRGSRRGARQAAPVQPARFLFRPVIDHEAVRLHLHEGHIAAIDGEAADLLAFLEAPDETGGRFSR